MRRYKRDKDVLLLLDDELDDDGERLKEAMSRIKRVLGRSE
jgi:hypothetical protein